MRERDCKETTGRTPLHFKKKMSRWSQTQEIKVAGVRRSRGHDRREDLRNQRAFPKKERSLQREGKQKYFLFPFPFILLTGNCVYRF